MLHSVHWWLATDVLGKPVTPFCKSQSVFRVSGQPIGPVFKDQAILACLTLEDRSDKFSRNVGNHQSTLRNVSEERRSHLHPAGSLK
jgi:hypothetical protein